MIGRRFLDGARRAGVLLLLTAVSACAAVTTVLSNADAPSPWWAPSAWVGWWRADPNAAAIALVTAALAALGLSLSIFQAFFSKAARESEARIRADIEGVKTTTQAEGQTGRDHAAALAAEAERNNAARHDENTAKFDALMAMVGQAGLGAGLNPAQLETVLRAYAHEGVPVDQAEALLLQSAQELTELRARLLRFSNADPVTADLKREAAEAIEAGSIEQARDLVLQAAERHRRAGEELADALRMHRLSEAEALAEAAGMEQSLSRLLESAALYAQAAETAAPFDSVAAWTYSIGQASALQKYGDLFPGLDRLAEAVAVLRDRALPLVAEQDMPADWALTQNNLGNALQTLGERERGDAGLDLLTRAVSAYEAALRVRTERDMPADWAGTQNNLGIALQTLGERAGGEAGLDLLTRSVSAYQAALRVYTERDMPADWAMTQNNLGNALSTLGEREGGEAGLDLLTRAVSAYEAALRVYTERDMPAQWALTQNNLGAALSTLGEREGGEAGLDLLNRAVSAYEAALRVYTERDMPADWAMTQNNLGIALKTLGERAGGEAGLDRLNQAVSAYEATLRVYAERDMPAAWALTQNNLGNALKILGERMGGEAGLDRLTRSVSAFEAALRVRTERDMPALWAMTVENLCLVHEVQSEITRDLAPVCNAVGDMDRVIAVFEAMQAGFYIEKARRNRDRMVALCRELGGTCAD